MTNTTVKYELVGHVAVITLNDPATLNAFSDAMIEALGQALDRAEAEAGAIVLTGEGKGFSSGLNLGLAPAEKQSREQRDTGARLERVFNPLLLRLRNLAIPLVIAANGVAAGIGCSIALVGDFIVASEKAYFLQAFASIGLVPDGGSPFLLAAAAGRVRAMEMMLLAEKIPAAQALEWGLINRVTPADETLTVALGIAARLAAGPTYALGLIRRLAWSALEVPFERQLALERDAQRAAGDHPDFDEGVAAFRERRPARFGSKS